MDRHIVKYLECVKEKQSLTVLEECIYSLNITITYSQASDKEKENMLSVLDLMLAHHNKIVSGISKSDNCSK